MPRLFDLIASVIDVDDDEVGDASDNANTEGWDSMREIMLATTLESEYGFTMTAVEMEDLHSVAGIRRVLAAHGIDEE